MIIKSHSNIPSIRRRVAIAIKKPMLQYKDVVYYKYADLLENDWRTSIVIQIYSATNIEMTASLLSIPGYNWRMPIKEIYWERLLQRWECIRPNET